MLRHSRSQTRAARERAIIKAMRTAWESGDAQRKIRGGIPFRPWGKYAKRKYFDCGRARCGICSAHKRWVRGATIQEQRLFLREFDYLPEVLG